MNTRDFCYWLQGFFEINGDNHLSPDQVEMIKNHLNLVFDKDEKTHPNYGRIFNNSVNPKPRRSIC